MEHVLTFSRSVTGYTHIRRQMPCQDASGTHTDPEGRFQVIAVADGHGDPACVRSGTGAGLAVLTALQCLREFAEISGERQMNEEVPTLREELQYPDKSRVLIRQLTNVLLSRWSQAVHSDFEQNPLTEAEKEQLYEAAFEGGGYGGKEQVEHYYGTTLLAALHLPPYLLILQQGDGVCVVIDSDAQVTEPVPEDTSCYGNVTTSLSDEEASDEIRYALLTDFGTGTVACFLGSDGIDSSFFKDPQLTGRFYLRMAVEADGQTAEEYQQRLTEELPELSRQGSGDDISVAGMLCQPLSEEFTAKCREQSICPAVS